MYRNKIAILKDGVFVKMLRVPVKLWWFTGLLCFCAFSGYSQSIEWKNPLLAMLDSAQSTPKGLLAERTIVLYSFLYRSDQLKKIQKTFERTGIDAVGYVPADMVMANQKTPGEAARYFNKREISFLALIEQEEGLFSIYFTRFNRTSSLVNNGQAAWKVVHPNLDTALQKVYRTAVRSEERKNFLINEVPETNLGLDVIGGRRLYFFAVDLKVDRLAVPRFEDASIDSTMHHFFTAHYPFDFSLTERFAKTKELRDKGFLYRLGYVHASAPVAKSILDYSAISNDDKHNETVSSNALSELKATLAKQMFYKFYVEHLPSGKVFLGTKWDADVQWLKALQNYIYNFKKELGIP